MSEKKHILVITTSFPDGEPGSEAAGSFVSDFVQELSKYVKVTVVVPRLSRIAPEKRGDLTICPFIVPRLPLSLLSPFNPFYWISILKVMFSGQRAVSQAVVGSDIDHILALWALPSGYWARNVWRQHGVPYSTWALGSDIWSLGKIPFVRGILSKVLKDSSRRFADGYQLKSEVETISGRSCEFLASVRELTVDGKKQLSRTPPYRFAFLGRWHNNKGIDLLLESLELLNDDDWSSIEEVRIYGGGLLEKQIVSRCNILRSAGRPLTVGGYLDKSRSADLLVWADYLLLPSRVESIPIIFSDAMQSGCPVVAMPVGDLPRLLSKYIVGVTAEMVSADAFVEAIRSAFNTSPDSFRVGLGKARGQFSVQLTAERLLQFIGG